MSQAMLVNPGDVHEVDAAVDGADVIRAIVNSIKYLPSMSAVRLLVIRNADKLSEGGSGALAKVLENPPPHLRVVAITGHPATMRQDVLRAFGWKPVMRAVT